MYSNSYTNEPWEDKWLSDFNCFMKQFWGMNNQDAGMDAQHLSRYRDLEPNEAALTFGEDYDLDRIDRRRS